MSPGQAREAHARREIDRLLQAAGWSVQDLQQADLHAARGVAIRELPLAPGHRVADYLLYVDGKACGVIEAKKTGATLTGVEVQSERYAQRVPPSLPAWTRPLPFVYESTGAETHVTNGLDPEPRARGVFAFHKPETLAEWLNTSPHATALTTSAGAAPMRAEYSPATFLSRVRSMPALVTQWGEHKLWPAQIVAICNLGNSLAQSKPRALIQMATGSGKTSTAISFIYRLIKYAGARRVLFLVDRGNLGRQTKKEFDQYVSPVNSFKFGEEYMRWMVQMTTRAVLSRLLLLRCWTCTSMLKGREVHDDLDEARARAWRGFVQERAAARLQARAPDRNLRER